MTVMIVPLIGSWSFAMALMGAAIYRRGYRNGVVDTTKKFMPFLELSGKWEQIHIEDEQKDDLQ